MRRLRGKYREEKERKAAENGATQSEACDPCLESIVSSTALKIPKTSRKTRKRGEKIAICLIGSASFRITTFAEV